MRSTRLRLTATVLAVVTAAGACSNDSATGAPTRSTGKPSAVELVALSTDATRVTGGDVLVAITGTTGDVTFTSDGDALDAEDRGLDDRGRRQFLLSGLADGDQTVTATTSSGDAHLDVVNHPVEGPVFSGPHTPMPTCNTEDFGLGPASTDDNCFAPTKTSWGYFGADRKLHDLADPSAVPADAYVATTGAGAGKPVVVEIERGVVNRGIFTITTANGVDWNRRLIYRFGGGCGTSYSQGFDLMGDPDPEVLAAGYALATNTLDTFQVNCNDVVSAESAMMTKEHFVEEHGVPDVTIGEGGSGGAIQQLLIAQNYPGILDAIAPILPFPDAISISGGVLDCALLNHFYRSPAGASFTDEQKVAINGHLTARTCDFWEQTFASAVNPSTCGFSGAIAGATAALPGLGAAAFPRPPEQEIYDAATNPDGLRCTLQDGAVNVYGKDPATGFARRAWDNVGVQYGLAALNSGVLPFDQFLDLNRRIGSYDIDGALQGRRAAADIESLETSYRTGRVVEDGGDLRRIPILAVNLYTDPMGDIHDRYRVMTIRERLRTDDGGQAPNLVIWTRGLPPGKSLIDSLTGAISLGTDVIGLLDQWATELAKAKAANHGRPIDGLLAATRPDTAVNACFEADGTLVAKGDDVYDGPGPCTDPYPVKGDPRTVAGEPIREDVVKCTTMPVADAVAAGVYTTKPTDEQIARLEDVFPDGVCDWTEPGVGQVKLGKPWRSFGT